MSRSTRKRAPPIRFGEYVTSLPTLKDAVHAVAVLTASPPKKQKVESRPATPDDVDEDTGVEVALAYGGSEEVAPSATELEESQFVPVGSSDLIRAAEKARDEELAKAEAEIAKANAEAVKARTEAEEARREADQAIRAHLPTPVVAPSPEVFTDTVLTELAHAFGDKSQVHGFASFFDASVSCRGSGGIAEAAFLEGYMAYGTRPTLPVDRDFFGSTLGGITKSLRPYDPVDTRKTKERNVAFVHYIGSEAADLPLVLFAPVSGCKRGLVVPTNFATDIARLATEFEKLLDSEHAFLYDLGKAHRFLNWLQTLPDNIGETEFACLFESQEVSHFQLVDPDTPYYKVDTAAKVTAEFVIRTWPTTRSVINKLLRVMSPTSWENGRPCRGTAVKSLEQIPSIGDNSIRRLMACFARGEVLTLAVITDAAWRNSPTGRVYKNLQIFAHPVALEVRPSRSKPFLITTAANVPVRLVLANPLAIEVWLKRTAVILGALAESGAFHVVEAKVAGARDPLSLASVYKAQWLATEPIY